MPNNRKVPEINSTSTADIAFMLLIFFIVSTTMSIDAGITRKLPPIEEDKPQDQPEVKERNVFIVLINRNNDLFVENGPMDISELKEKTQEFILNPNDAENLPEKILLSKKRDQALQKKENAKAKEIQKAIDIFGDRYVTKGVVSLQNDMSTKYEAYIKVQDELMRAFNELQNQLAKEAFGKEMDELTEEEQDLVKVVFPLAISEAEPAKVGGGK
jgi:biopolymer transport protein ExbD